MVRVTFEPSGISGEVPDSTTILEAALELGEELEHECGGNASCGTCNVRVETWRETLSPIEEAERDVLERESLPAPFRLSCQSKLLKNTVVTVRKPSDELDTKDRELLNILQSEFPLSAEPFRTMSDKLGIPEEEVIQRIKRLKREKIIRQISAIFDTRGLGYRSSLVAARVAPEHLDEAAKIFNQHPGITHNYKRNHPFNLWFTIAVPPNSRLGLDRSVELLGQMAGVESIRILPTLKLFKIGVDLDMTGKDGVTGKTKKKTWGEDDREKQDKTITTKDITVIREMQKDMVIVSRPFDAPARAAGMTVDQLLDHANGMMTRGLMRRMAAVLHHRKAGFSANGMGVWKVPADRLEDVAQKMASFRAVSHCYLRPTYPDWPYNVFTMVHGKTMKDCEEVLDKIGEESGITEHAVLYSTKEYKKVRMQYFTRELEEWEERYAGNAVPS